MPKAKKLTMMRRFRREALKPSSRNSKPASTSTPVHGHTIPATSFSSLFNDAEVPVEDLTTTIMKTNRAALFVWSSSTSFAIVFLLSDVLRIGTTCRGFSIVHSSSDSSVGRIPPIFQPRFQSRKRRRRSSVGGMIPHFVSRQENESEPEYNKDGENMTKEDKVASAAAAAAAAQQREEQYHSILEYSIDSFLRGEYDRPFAEDAAAPLPGLTPQETVETALESLCRLDDPEPSHGAAVLLRFCAPLSRADRWGASSFLPHPSKNKKRRSQGGGGGAPPRKSDDWPVESASSSSSRDDDNDSDSSQLPINSYSWKEVLRGALTPTMLARRIRASQDFSGLLDWTKLDLTEGAYSEDPDRIIGVPSNVAFVNAALYFEKGDEPMFIQFTLRRMNGVWLIDSAQRSDQQLFQLSQEGEDDKYDGDW
jgi:hypothetical protein